MSVTAIIAAGGRGQRFGGTVPKQLITVDGRSILERSVALFLAHPEVDEIVVALPAEIAADPPDYLRRTTKPVHVVAGGPRRQDSVFNAFQAVSNRAEVVVVHDAARPFASLDLISRTIAAARKDGAAVAALPARDTVKRADAAGSTIVRETIPRELVHLAQTPQAFTRRVLREALTGDAMRLDATDEAALAERAGHQVRLVEGEASNIKITTPDDLSFVAALDGNVRGSAAAAAPVRVGSGYDSHRLVEGRPLMLGGVVIPSEKGALGHSDADVVCHAVTDAILGGAAAGDIGSHFPDSDARWKDASSIDLLARAVEIVRGRGLAVVNVDVTVVLEAPKIKGYVEQMRTSVADALGVDFQQVSIKGKTNEGMDAVGRGEAIVAHAVAMLAAG